MEQHATEAKKSRYRDPEKRREYMRNFMRKKRAAEKQMRQGQEEAAVS